MVELNILSKQQEADILASVEEYCQLILPAESEHLETVSVHIYQKEHQQSVLDKRIFQIRWGLHQIFQDKHLPDLSPAETTEILKHIIKKHSKKIRHALFSQCQEILSDTVLLELEPEINQRNIAFSSYKLKVCNARNTDKNYRNSGWLNFCVFISWIDENGDFQEFIYPLLFSEKKKRFHIPANEIVTAFIRYRDSI